MLAITDRATILSTSPLMNAIAFWLICPKPIAQSSEGERLIPLALICENPHTAKKAIARNEKVILLQVNLISFQRETCMTYSKRKKVMRHRLTAEAQCFRRELNGLAKP